MQHAGQAHVAALLAACRTPCPACRGAAYDLPMTLNSAGFFSGACTLTVSCCACLSRLTGASRWRPPIELGIGDVLAGVGERMHHAVASPSGRPGGMSSTLPAISISRRRASAAVCRMIMPPCRIPLPAVAPPMLTVSAAVAHDDAHALPGNVDLLRHQLRDRGFQALPAVDLAVIGDHGAVRIDGDVGGELVGRSPAGAAVATAVAPSANSAGAASATTSAPVADRKARRLKRLLRSTHHGTLLTPAGRRA